MTRKVCDPLELLIAILKKRGWIHSIGAQLLSVQ
jgi:hypothetical protein